MKNGTVVLKTDVDTHTIKQYDYVNFLYDLKIKFTLPMVYFITLNSTYYFVPAEGEREKRIFASSGRITGKIRYVGNRRGVYDVGSFALHINDPLGFFKRKINVYDKKRVYVFPFVVPFDKLNIYLSEPLSGIKAKYQINSDYTSIAGVRDYIQGDPLSMIHWKQTAHRNKLTVKELDFTASKRILIVLNLYKKNLQFQDSAAAIAASIANYSISRHLPVGLIVNGTPPEDLPLGENSFHLMKLFKLLALASDEDAVSIEKFLRTLSSKLPFGVEVFFIDKDITRDTMLSLMRIKPFVSRLNIVLLPDSTFVLPHEKPPRYYFKEDYYLTVLGYSKEALAKEGIFVYPILGKDYASKLEKV
jgi:uncharacterized protein (DUF58 family)